MQINIRSNIALASTLALTIITTLSLPQQASAECIQLTGSRSCPSYQSAWFNKDNNYAINSVDVFDRLISDTVHAVSNPQTILNQLQCVGGKWDGSRIRYGYAFFCNYYLNLPAVIGGDPGSTDDCNVIMATSGNQMFTPMNVSTCLEFKDSLQSVLNDPDACPNTVDPTYLQFRSTFSMTVSDSCANEGKFVGNTANGEDAIDMQTDPIEKSNCGFGTFNDNSTTALVAAYSYCFNNVPEACCFYDPVLHTALDNGDLGTPTPPAKPSTDSSTCNVTFNRFFKMPCSLLAGTIVGAIFAVGSMVIVYMVVKAQDKEAMKKTKSGKFQEDTKWVRDWWNSSGLGNSGMSTAARNQKQQEHNQLYQGQQQQQSMQKVPAIQHDDLSLQLPPPPPPKSVTDAGTLSKANSLYQQAGLSPRLTSHNPQASMIRSSAATTGGTIATMTTTSQATNSVMGTINSTSVQPSVDGDDFMSRALSVHRQQSQSRSMGTLGTRSRQPNEYATLQHPQYGYRPQLPPTPAQPPQPQQQVFGYAGYDDAGMSAAAQAAAMYGPPPGAQQHAGYQGQQTAQQQRQGGQQYQGQYGGYGGY
ncbi:hypothetical protein HDU76_009055 [Blyttiomyces sp. JEL0837]|nr:hypothetical protein HDU76_009055 [Blyttiomyces sp. JEL0837]